MGRFHLWKDRIEDWICEKPISFALIVAFVLCSLAFWRPIELRREALAPIDNAARVYFGGSRTVGQSFTPMSGLREIHLPLGWEPDTPLSPLILHVRDQYLGEDIRTSVTFTPEPVGGATIFRFDAITNPPDSLIWIVEAPHGPTRAAWVYREQDALAFPEGSAFVSGKEVRGNFAFTQVGSRPFLFAWASGILPDIQLWERQSVLLFIVTAGLFFWLRREKIMLSVPVQVWLGILVAVTIIFHAWFAQQLPLIIDEGAYLQDAAQTTWTFWPLRDFLTKGPVYVLALKAWGWFTPEGLIGWRMMSAIGWAGVVAFSVVLARRFHLPLPAQFLTGVLMAISPGVVGVTTPLLLQVLSSLFAVAALWSVLRGIQEDRLIFVVLGAGLMTAGFFTRVSTAAAGIAGAVMILLMARQRWRMLGVYSLTGLLLTCLVALAAGLAMGIEKTAVLFNLEAVAVGQLQSARVGEMEPIIRWSVQAMTVLWRGGIWILAGIAVFPVFLIERLGLRGRFCGVAIWMGVMANALYHLFDMSLTLPTAAPLARVVIITVAFAVPVIWLLRSLLAPALPWVSGWRWAAVCGVWLVLLGTFYRGWGLYREVYVVEFLPALTLLGAAGLARAWQAYSSRFGRAVLVGLAAVSWWHGLSLMVGWPISGTIAPEAIEGIARLVQQHVPVGEEIFTAQPIVAVAGHRPIIRGYSHPGWILYARLNQVPEKLRRVYFSDDDQITHWLESEVQYVMTDPRTNEVYFNYSDERQRILHDRFVLVGEVKNELAEEPFRLYRRRRANEG